MRLVLVSTQRTWGGGENVLAQLALGCQRAGHTVGVAAPAGSAVAKWSAKDPSIERLDLPGRGRGPQSMWRLRRWIATTGADVVLLNDPHAITYGGAALAGLGVPRVGVKHTCFPVRSAWKHNRLVEQVVCVAKAARRECLLAGVEESQLHVIHAGLDRMVPTPQETADAEQLFAAKSPASKHVLAIGSLLPVKGFDTLVEAAARSTGWRLWIAGEGPERPALESQIDRLGLQDRVTLLGFRRDIGALLTAADVFASASHREGLSLVLVEAMMAGAPVVATPVGGNGEALQIDIPGESLVARAVAPNDPDAMAAAIAAALEPTTANAERVANAKAWADRHFTIERMTRDYLALFTRLVGEPTRARAA
ncbi:D-inositol 3-phosphate glycosyltransferase [Botrimarina colliarenosi]|uniref:D-inositol 3-phosphate glycosyltransferase n=1 Tax=Botrimarina colliarenosi TaxID=2528001 RepID=A0A5C6AMW7_9BACT|nr:glycosyltransferase [Botrimarina colliarenosi]TWU00599.1 D-inositol 3-phosphate glycosyltransferase [Botrimarina colliarenosi]